MRWLPFLAPVAPGRERGTHGTRSDDGRPTASDGSNPVTFDGAEAFGAFELARLWGDRLTWPLKGTASDKLAELGVCRLYAVAEPVAADLYPPGPFSPAPSPRQSPSRLAGASPRRSVAGIGARPGNGML